MKRFYLVAAILAVFFMLLPSFACAVACDPTGSGDDTCLDDCINTNPPPCSGTSGPVCNDSTLGKWQCCPPNTSSC